MFEKPKNRVLEGQEDDPFAIYMMYLDQESRLLVLAGATHIMLFKFSKQEVTYEVTVCIQVDLSVSVCGGGREGAPVAFFFLPFLYSNFTLLVQVHFSGGHIVFSLSVGWLVCVKLKHLP
ncbi:hypothetical protein DPMN_054378 [Dreissena polymorpha]|uniref:Uncharacterized protein n=1 Tax=Dreissena polymorpha TaxID=45954 RepID=A0A9D4CPS1_DREPO|nr:hypothetical protein DPMN_054378 [Dreissena polymorpha]